MSAGGVDNTKQSVVFQFRTNYGRVVHEFLTPGSASKWMEKQLLGTNREFYQDLKFYRVITTVAVDEIQL